MKEALSPQDAAASESLTQVEFGMLIAVASARQAASPTVRALKRGATPRTLDEGAAARRVALSSGDRACGTELAGSFRADQICPQLTGIMQDFVALTEESVDERRINHSASIDIETAQR